MTRRLPSRPAAGQALVGPASVGRIGGVLAALGGLVLVATSLIADGAAVTVSLGVGVFALAVGLAFTRIDWSRRPTSDLLFLVPLAVTGLGVQNASFPDPYLAGLQYPLIAMWVGMSQPRFVPTVVSIGLAAGYAIPLALVAPSRSLVVATPSMAIMCAAAGEMVAYLAHLIRQAHERERRSQERRYEALLGQSSDVSALVDGDGRLRYLSPGVNRMLGAGSRERLLADATGGDDGPAPVDGPHPRRAPDNFPPTFDALIHPDDVDRVKFGVRRLAAEPDRVVFFRLRIRRSDGTWLPVEAAGRNLLDDPDVGGLLFAIRDISQRQALERELERRATHDELTGLLNRWGLFEELERSPSGAAGRVALLFCDLDRFKDVNDELGHRAGDAVLREVALRLRRAVPDPNPVARLGGDEFGVLLWGADAARASELAEQLVKAMRRAVTVGDREVTVPLTVGIAVTDEDEGGKPALDRLLVDADLAMYAAKTGTDDRSVTTYHDDLRVALLERTQLQRELRAALERNEIVAYYQPIVSIADGRPVGVEALARWRHPERGILPPGLFIGLAERTGLVTRLNEQILARACAELAELRARSDQFDELYVSVNVTATQLASDRLLDRLRIEIARNGLQPSDLCLEVTETEPLVTREVLDRMGRLRRLGVRLAVDDFGTGYSSLRYLHELPLDTIKIDKSFIDLMDQPETRALILSIVEIARNLSMTTVAEGVEHPAQTVALRQLGVARAQGYLYARPVPPDELVPALTALTMLAGQPETDRERQPVPSQAAAAAGRDRSDRRALR